MSVKRVFVLLAAITAAPLIGQHRQPPAFESYKAKVFSGVPAAPVISGEYEERYHQQIVDGVVRGDGVLRDGIEQPGVNFAGRYIVIQMSAGAPGLRMVIVDAITGKIIYPPISIHGVGARSFDLPLLVEDNSVPRNPIVEFRPDSRLMVVSATLNGAPTPADFYYELDGRGWNLIRKVTRVPRQM